MWVCVSVVPSSHAAKPIAQVSAHASDKRISSAFLFISSPLVFRSAAERGFAVRVVVRFAHFSPEKRLKL